MSFADELFKFALLLIKTCPAMLNTSSATCYHAGFSWKVHWVLEIPICGLATTGECRWTFVPEALCSVEFFAHVTFQCIESTFSFLHKELFTPYPHRTAFNPRPTQLCGLPDPTRKCGLTRPAQYTAVKLYFYFCNKHFNFFPLKGIFLVCATAK